MLGMDVSTRLCPDLRSFKQYLVSGKFPRSGSEDPSLNDHRSDDSVLRLLSSLQRLLSKCRCIAGDFPVSIVLHDSYVSSSTNSPEGIKWSDFFDELSKNIQEVLSPDHFEIVSGAFDSGLLRTFSCLKGDADNFTVFISPFQYIFASKNQVNHFGFGYLLLSKDKPKDNKYEVLAEINPLVTQNLDIDSTSSGHQANREADPHYSFNEIFLHQPVVQLIGSILELHHGSKFALLNNSSKMKDALSTSVLGTFIQPWFSSSYENGRQNLSGFNGAELIAREVSSSDARPNHPSLFSFGQYLLPIAINDKLSVVSAVDQGIETLTEAVDLELTINNVLKSFQSRSTLSNTLVVIGDSIPDLINELDRAKSSVAASLESETDWQTPNGSYFTPRPLGPDAKIAFVYPGAFGTYINMGSEVFYLFPELYELLETITADPASSINAPVIFPRDANPEEIPGLQEQLNNNPIQMIASGVCFSYLFTEILRTIFKVGPHAAYGYSLGENSMMFALGIWQQADAMRTSLEVSPIFHSRVSGPQNAIRQYWNIADDEIDKNHTSIWANYVIMAPQDKVKEALIGEDRVYITHINAPRQVVIGGEKGSCQRIVKNLKYMNLQAPYHHAIHCPPVASEYDGFHRLHDWPVENQPGIPVYSAAQYAPLKLNSEAIAHSFARMLTNPIDFPRLTDLAYKDGARIFIELGAGSNCSKWIGAILKGKPHLAVSMNAANVSDHLSILRLLARLISHNVSLDLSPMWGGYHD